MTHLIDKSALAVEIDRLENKLYYEPEKFKDIGAKMALDSLKSFLDTLEVKEVDLEKEIKEVQRNYKTIEEYEGYPCTMYANGIEWIAKHFFELGMSVRNKAQKGENI